MLGLRVKEPWRARAAPRAPPPGCVLQGTRSLRAPDFTTQDQTRSNCQSQFLGFQGQYTPKVEIPVLGVPERYYTSWIVFYNCFAKNLGWVLTSTYDEYSGSMKITTRLDHTSRCKPASGINWSKRWTCRVLIMNARRD